MGRNRDRKLQEQEPETEMTNTQDGKDGSAWKRFKRRLSENRFTGKFVKIYHYIKQHGVRYTLKQLNRKIKARIASRRPVYTKADYRRQRKTVFDQNIKISILVPLYNTPQAYLREMIRSVQKQTYSDWELCLADGSDAEHGDVGDVVAEFAATDRRIVYQKLERNLGISGNTNACIDMASGDYIALFDHDDLLHPSALYEVMRAICDKGADFIYTDENTFSKSVKNAYCPHHKPDFSPDLLRSYNYICHFTVFARSLLDRVGGFRSECDGSQDYDMILRLTEVAKCIVHIPIILYYWRAHRNSVASDISAKPYTLVAAKRAISEHLERVGLCGTVTDSAIPSTYRIRYEIPEKPLISIVIPNMDHIDLLERCIRSITTLTTYPQYEILIVENNSRRAETFAYYDKITAEYPNIRVLRWAYEFNYSKINNFALQEVKGTYTVLLNNDIEIITPEWLEEMLMFVQRPDVGAAGMMLYYPDDTVQHAGVILGVGGIAGHSHKYYQRGDGGYMSRMTLAQDLSAVTAAAMMLKTAVFREVGGFEESLAVAFNDVDLCMKIRRAGYLIVFTPYAEAYHHESKSRGLEDTPQKQKRFYEETETFRARWQKELDAGDPYYNPNLTLEHENFGLKRK